ncbi:MAG: Hsp20/alpha crystallin family protein [Gammaproteobacteria bacterium]|nr:MAG: Hsp20/alpha crystallin family protein [Gammaproteobacteria bacterium]
MAAKKETKQTQEKGKALERARPAAPLLAPLEEMEQMMERMMESFFPRGFLRPLRAELPALPEVRVPKVDIIDRENEVIVRAEMPGVNKEDVEVTVSDNVVTIRGKTKKEEEEEKEGEYYRKEISYGEFVRSVALPVEVEGDKAKAKLKEGILEVVLPKAETAKRKAIPVEEG